MEYRCVVIPINKLQFNKKEALKPLCDTCSTIDCDNCIESKTVSILGTNYIHRVKMGSVFPGFVIDCEGYTAK